VESYDGYAFWETSFDGMWHDASRMKICNLVVVTLCTNARGAI
jgi:hypothetical protein